MHVLVVLVQNLQTPVYDTNRCERLLEIIDGEIQQLLTILQSILRSRVRGQLMKKARVFNRLTNMLDCDIERHLNELLGVSGISGRPR